jgi:hypothetical protein
MKRTLIVLAALLLPSVVLAKPPLPAGPAAELAFELHSDSTGGGLGAHWNVFAFEDPACPPKQKGKRVAHKKRNKPMPPVQLVAGRPVTLAFYYLEANYAENRECSYTWTFTPSEGVKYNAHLAVSRDVRCSLALVDAAAQPVPGQTPVHSCVAGLYGQHPNGEPARITYRVRIGY